MASRINFVFFIKIKLGNYLVNIIVHNNNWCSKKKKKKKREPQRAEPCLYISTVGFPGGSDRELSDKNLR